MMINEMAQEIKELRERAERAEETRDVLLAQIIRATEAAEEELGECPEDPEDGIRKLGDENARLLEEISVIKNAVSLFEVIPDPDTRKAMTDAEIAEAIAEYVKGVIEDLDVTEAENARLLDQVRLKDASVKSLQSAHKEVAQMRYRAQAEAAENLQRYEKARLHLTNRDKEKARLRLKVLNEVWEKMDEATFGTDPAGAWDTFENWLDQQRIDALREGGE